MKHHFRIFNTMQIVVIAALMTFNSVTFAKPIDMYDQPKSDSKKLGTIDVSTGVMPIFSPKGSDWVKVADPHNGNVGWVKASELKSGSPTSFSFTQKVIDGDKGQQNYQVFEFGNSPQLTTEQTKIQLQKLQAQPLINPQTVQQSIQKIVNDINTIYQQQINSMKESDIPIIMPIVIFPAQKNTPPVMAPTQSTPKAVDTKK